MPDMLTESSKDREAIEKVVAGYGAAWNAHDSKAFACLFTEAAAFTFWSGTEIHGGRQEIEREHATRFATLFRDSRQVIEITRIRFVRPDVASVVVTWTMTGAFDKAGARRPERTGLLNLIVTKEDDVWLIDVFHVMELPGRH